MACAAPSDSPPGGDGTPRGSEVERVKPRGVCGRGEGTKLGLKGSGEGCVRGLGAVASAVAACGVFWCSAVYWRGTREGNERERENRV